MNILIKYVYVLIIQYYSLRPVLKHGPRSLSYMQVVWCYKPICVMKVRGVKVLY